MGAQLMITRPGGRSSYVPNPVFGSVDAPVNDFEYFPPEFFSGCDISFVFLTSGEDEKFDVTGYLEQDILLFTLTIRQLKDPQFGYNDYLYNRIAKGNILIMGQIGIAYTRKGKLFEDLRKAASQISGKWGPMDKTGLPDADGLKGRERAWKGLSMDQKIDRLTKSGPGATGQNIENAVTSLSTQSKEGHRIDSITGKNDMFYVGDFGMSIMINYNSGRDAEGVTPESIASETFSGRDLAEPWEDKTEVLHEVELSSMTKDIRPKGQPVIELYSFVARNIT